MKLAELRRTLRWTGRIWAALLLASPAFAAPADPGAARWAALAAVPTQAAWTDCVTAEADKRIAPASGPNGEPGKPERDPKRWFSAVAKACHPQMRAAWPGMSDELYARLLADARRHIDERIAALIRQETATT